MHRIFFVSLTPSQIFQSQHPPSMPMSCSVQTRNSHTSSAPRPKKKSHCCEKGLIVYGKPVRCLNKSVVIPVLS